MMKPNAKIAVITRTKDREIFLRRALNSVSQQTLKDILWCVVSDGQPSDEVRSIVQEGNERGIQSLLVVNEGQGIEAASNQGITSCDSEFIVIHDDDDTWAPTFLADMLYFLDSRKNLYAGAICHANMITEIVTPEGDIQIEKSEPYKHQPLAICLSEMAVYNLFPPITFIYQRKEFAELAGYDENLPVLGDWEFNLRFLEKYDIGVVSKVLANYHVRKPGDKANDANGNTVTNKKAQHLEYDALIRNKKLREDLALQKMGLGYLLAELGQFRGILRKLTDLQPETIKLVRQRLFDETNEGGTSS